MVDMKTYLKSILRGLKSNLSKLISLIFIVLLGISFTSGISSVPSKINNSYSDSLKAANIFDVDLKDKTGNGFSDEYLNKLNDLDFVSRFESLSVFDNATFNNDIKLSELVKGTQLETYITNDENNDSMFLYQDDTILSLNPSLINEDNSRLYLLNDTKREDINTFKIVEGRLPTNDDEVAIEDKMFLKQHHLNDTVVLFGKEKKIVGKIDNPIYFNKEKEVDYQDQKDLDNIFYLDYPSLTYPSIKEALVSKVNAYFDREENRNKPLTDTIRPLFISSLENENPSFIPKNLDIFIVFENRDSYDLFTDEYDDFVKESIEKLNLDGSVTALTLKESYSYALLDNYTSKVDVIGFILPIFFITVVALVVSTTFNRMVEEERSQIGCLSSLGYSDSRIALKYLLIVLACCLIGSIGGLLIGFFGLSTIIFNAFNGAFYLPVMEERMNLWFPLVATFINLLISLLITKCTIAQFLKESTASLLLPKTPKAGKKILLERAFFWNSLPFKMKSCFRNIFRYKKNLAMTVISVAGSTALVFAGFALIDVINGMSKDRSNYASFSKTISPVAIFIIIFAITLALFIIYNLTNMNIMERNREIATLKVLGYSDREVCFYIYREILIMSSLGIIVGFPLGIGLITGVLYYLEFGNLADVRFYSYLSPIIIMIGFIILIDLCLIPKIKKIDMITSLKSVD